MPEMAKHPVETVLHSL